MDIPLPGDSPPKEISLDNIPIPEDTNRYSPSLPNEDEALEFKIDLSEIELPAIPPKSELPPKPTVLGKNAAKKRLLAFSMAKQNVSLPKKSKPEEDKSSEHQNKKKQKMGSLDKARNTISEIEELKRQEKEMQSLHSSTFPLWTNIDDPDFLLKADTQRVSSVENFLDTVIKKSKSDHRDYSKKRKDRYESRYEKKDIREDERKDKRDKRDKKEDERDRKDDKKDRKEYKIDDRKEDKRDDKKEDKRDDRKEDKKDDRKEEKKDDRPEDKKESMQEPKNWKEFNDCGFKLIRGYRKRKHQLENLDTSKEIIKEEQGMAVSLLDTPKTLIRPLLVKGIRNREWELESWQVKYTSTKPSISFSPHPSYINLPTMTRNEMLATLSDEVLEIVSKFLTLDSFKRFKPLPRCERRPYCGVKEFLRPTKIPTSHKFNAIYEYVLEEDNEQESFPVSKWDREDESDTLLSDKNGKFTSVSSKYVINSEKSHPTSERKGKEQHEPLKSKWETEEHENLKLEKEQVEERNLEVLIKESERAESEDSLSEKFDDTSNAEGRREESEIDDFPLEEYENEEDFQLEKDVVDVNKTETIANKESKEDDSLQMFQIDSNEEKSKEHRRKDKSKRKSKKQDKERRENRTKEGKKKKKEGRKSKKRKKHQDSHNIDLSTNKKSKRDISVEKDKYILQPPGQKFEEESFVLEPKCSVTKECSETKEFRVEREENASKQEETTTVETTPKSIEVLGYEKVGFVKTTAENSPTKKHIYEKFVNIKNQSEEVKDGGGLDARRKDISPKKSAKTSAENIPTKTHIYEKFVNIDQSEEVKDGGVLDARQKDISPKKSAKTSAENIPTKKHIYEKFVNIIDQSEEVKDGGGLDARRKDISPKKSAPQGIESMKNDFEGEWSRTSSMDIDIENVLMSSINKLNQKDRKKHQNRKRKLSICSSSSSSSSSSNSSSSSSDTSSSSTSETDSSSSLSSIDSKSKKSRTKKNKDKKRKKDKKKSKKDNKKKSKKDKKMKHLKNLLRIGEPPANEIGLFLKDWDVDVLPEGKYLSQEETFSENEEKSNHTSGNSDVSLKDDGLTKSPRLSFKEQLIEKTLFPFKRHFNIDMFNDEKAKQNSLDMYGIETKAKMEDFPEDSKSIDMYSPNVEEEEEIDDDGDDDDVIDNAIKACSNSSQLDDSSHLFSFGVNSASEEARMLDIPLPPPLPETTPLTSFHNILQQSPNAVTSPKPAIQIHLKKSLTFEKQASKLQPVNIFAAENSDSDSNHEPLKEINALCEAKLEPPGSTETENKDKPQEVNSLVAKDIPDSKLVPNNDKREDSSHRRDSERKKRRDSPIRDHGRRDRNRDRNKDRRSRRGSRERKRDSRRRSRSRERRRRTPEKRKRLSPPRKSPNQKSPERNRSSLSPKHRGTGQNINEENFIESKVTENIELRFDNISPNRQEWDSPGRKFVESLQHSPGRSPGRGSPYRAYSPRRTPESNKREHGSPRRKNSKDRGRYSPRRQEDYVRPYSPRGYSPQRRMDSPRSYSPRKRSREKESPRSFSPRRHSNERIRSYSPRRRTPPRRESFSPPRRSSPNYSPRNRAADYSSRSQDRRDSTYMRGYDREANKRSPSFRHSPYRNFSPDRFRSGDKRGSQDRFVKRPPSPIRRYSRSPERSRSPRYHSPRRRSVTPLQDSKWEWNDNSLELKQKHFRDFKPWESFNRHPEQSDFQTSLADSTISDSELVRESSSPKRLSLDERIKIELGEMYDLGKPPQSVPMHGEHCNYYYGNVQPNRCHYPPAAFVRPILPNTSRLPPTWDPSQPPPPINKIVQVGNVLQVVPSDFGPISNPVLPPPKEKEVVKVVQVGNVLQVVPSRITPVAPPLTTPVKVLPVPAPSAPPMPPVTVQHSAVSPAAVQHSAMHPVVAHPATPSPVLPVPTISGSLMPVSAISGPLVAPSAMPGSTVPLEVTVAVPTPVEHTVSPEISKANKIKSLPLPPAHSPESLRKAEERQRRKEEKELRKRKKEEKAARRMLRKALLRERIALAEEQNSSELNKENDDVPEGKIGFIPPPDKGILLSMGFGLLNPEKRKTVSFADGIRPGEGTSPSGGEEHCLSPPPNIRKTVRRKRRKRKVKVRIVRLDGASAKVVEREQEDDLSPPPPPPGTPPPEAYYDYTNPSYVYPPIYLADEEILYATSCVVYSGTPPQQPINATLG